MMVHVDHDLVPYAILKKFIVPYTRVKPNAIAAYILPVISELISI